jgi:hypothetical protein
MRSKKVGAIAAVAGSLAAGGVLGALLFAPTVGLAQETPTPSPGGTGSVTDEDRGLCGSGASLASAAEAIGIDESELTAALREGQTIAEVARENGVQVSAVVGAMVADAEARIDQAVEDGELTQAEADEKKAELQETITALVNEELALGRGPFGGRGPGFPWPGDDSSDDEAESATSV